jgi:hypothetical protein
MKNHSLTTALPRQSKSAIVSVRLIVLTLLGILASHSVAENPWDSSSVGWSSAGHRSSSRGWASWNATTGGTFSTHRSTHAPSEASRPAEPFHAAPAAETVQDSNIDPVMLKAGNIAEQRALPHSTLRCWHYVKDALVAAGGVLSRPQTAYAKEAGRELVENYGFVRLAVASADRAPVGSVLVYGGPGAGHVELRTPHGFVSDFRSSHASNLPFLGAYARVGHRNIETAQVVTTVGAGS